MKAPSRSNDIPYGEITGIGMQKPPLPPVLTIPIPGGARSLAGRIQKRSETPVLHLRGTFAATIGASTAIHSGPRSRVFGPRLEKICTRLILIYKALTTALPPFESMPARTARTPCGGRKRR